MLLFQREKNCWHIREYAIMHVLESLGGLTSYNELKKYLVAKKKDSPDKPSEQSLLQKIIKKEIESIPVNKRPILSENFKFLRMSEPTLIKVYEGLEKEKVIDRVKGRRKGQKKIQELFRINKKYKGYVTEINDTARMPLYRGYLWSFIIEHKSIQKSV